MGKKKKKRTSGAAKRKKKREKERAIEEALAEMERLKLGPTALWTGLVRDHRDIFAAHVFPKLNETDRLFFSHVNRESCDALAYAYNCQELSEEMSYMIPIIGAATGGVAVCECTSISTLEWAWDNMSWGSEDRNGNVKDQVWFCDQVVGTNKLELLKWAREVKHCEWSELVIHGAAYLGNLEMLKYCFANGCPCDIERASKSAVLNGHLDCLRFLFDIVKPSRHVESDIAKAAAGKGYRDILKYLVEERRISDEIKQRCVLMATVFGQLDCLQYLMEEARTPLDGRQGLDERRIVCIARLEEQQECENYLLEKGCPEPTDEEYARFVEKTRRGELPSL